MRLTIASAHGSRPHQPTPNCSSITKISPMSVPPSIFRCNYVSVGLRSFFILGKWYPEKIPLASLVKGVIERTQPISGYSAVTAQTQPARTRALNRASIEEQPSVRKKQMTCPSVNRPARCMSRLSMYECLSLETRNHRINSTESQRK